MKKTVKELRPGDVLCYGDHGAPNRVVLETSRCDQTVKILTAALGPIPRFTTDTLAADTLIEVEPRLNPDLVDDLIMAAREWIEGRPPTEAHRKMVRDIIDIMVPPMPPTPTELLDALAAVTKYAMLDPERLDSIDHAQAAKAEKDAVALLNRARRAGLLK